MCWVLVVGRLKVELETGDRAVGFFDAVEWMACPALSHAFMGKYLNTAMAVQAALGTSGKAKYRG